MTALIIYFIISFTTGAWHLTWIIFLITRAIQGILQAIMDLVRGDRPGVPYVLTPQQKKLQSQIDTALWLAVVALYFIVSFATSAWYITWVTFFFGVALDSLVSILFLLGDKPTDHKQKEDN